MVSAKYPPFCTNRPTCQGEEAREGNGKIVSPPILMLQSSAASLCPNGQRKESSGQLPIFIGGEKNSITINTTTYPQYVHILYVHNIFRLKGLNYTPDEDPQPRKRSNSLPVPKIEVTSHEMIKMDFKEKLPNIEESCGEALLGGSSDR